MKKTPCNHFFSNQIVTLAGGVYQLSGSPFVTWKIENPDASPSTYNRLRITETRGADIRTNDAVYTAATGSWKLSYPGGVREDQWTVTTVTNGAVQTPWGAWVSNFSRTVTAATRVPGGADQFKVRRVYQGFSWGEGLVEETLDPDNQPRTTTYVYNEWGSASRGLPLVKALHPDGSWAWYEYDAQNRRSRVTSGVGDQAPGSGGSPPSAHTLEYYYGDAVWPVYGSGDDGTLWPDVPRLVTESVQYYAVSQRYTAIVSAGLRIEAQGGPVCSGWNDPNNLFTTNRYYTSGPNQGRLLSTVRPDGTFQTFTYAQDANGLYQTNCSATGRPDSTYVRVIEGTTNLTILNLGGYTFWSLTRDVLSGYTNAQDVCSNFDYLGRPGRVTHLDNTYEDTAYCDCSGLYQTTDRDGVMTQYQYDTAKRQVATTRLSITTSNVLDAVGHVLQTTRYGSSGPAVLQAQCQYDLAGELTRETNALGGVTSYARSTSANGGLVRTTTYPDGGTRIEEYYCDGSLKKVTGTAVQPVRYEYGVDTGADYGSRYTLEVKLKADGSDSAEWTETFTDGAGHPYKTLYAAPAAPYPASLTYYNNAGQAWKQVDPDGVITLSTYNAKGEPDCTITALSGTALGLSTYTDLLSSLATIKGGTDRVSRTTNDIVSSHGFAVQRSRSYVWPTNNSSAPLLVSQTETATDGLRAWQTALPDSAAPLVSQARTVYAGSGYRYATNIAPDSSYAVSQFQNGRLLAATRFDSINNQLSSINYSYDPHGRQSGANDARNGTTTYQYNAADLVTNTITPAPGAGQSAQTTTTWHDTSLRAWKTTLPDSTCLTNKFDLTGLLTNTCGSRAYPVSYTYDPQGRMKTMTTWTNFAAHTGGATTTWYYDDYRGWLTNKVYADTHGVLYSNTPAGRLAGRTWARGLTTTYTYDAAGSLYSVDYSDSSPGITYSYDRLGRPATVAQNSMTTTFAYNDASQLVRESYSGGTLNGLAVTNAYDQFLRRTNLAWSVNSQLSTINFSYDAASRLQTVRDGNNTARYADLANSPLLDHIYFTNSGTLRMTTTNQYDLVNRLTAIGSAIGSSTIGNWYAYNCANQRTGTTNADSTYWAYSYDYLGQVTSGKKYWSGGTVVPGQQFEYTFDDIGNRTGTKAGGDQNGSNLRTAGYQANNVNQYTRRDVPGAVDVMGDVLATNSVTINGQAPSYRNGEYFRTEIPVVNTSTAVWTNITVVAPNEPTVSGNVFVAKTQEQFAYDYDGNLTNDGRWGFTWDAENRLVRMIANTAVGPPQRIDFEYDSRGRRIGKKVWNNKDGTGTPVLEEKFVYDGWNLLAELDSQYSALRTYTWGLDLSGTMQGAGGVGGLLAMSAGSSGQVTNSEFVAYDGNGNVRALVNSTNGAIWAEYDYGPFGELLRATGPMAEANPFRFSTKYQDDEADLVYYPPGRYYSPSWGGWLSRDPAKEPGFGMVAGDELVEEPASASDGNLYGFVGNNPINQIDLLGLAFYAIDGTWTKASDRANPWQLYNETAERPRYYHRGPRLGATGLDAWGIATEVKKQICSDFCQAKKSGGDFKINLTGWSRGAITAAGVARLLNDFGCDCCSTRYRPVSVNWIGLFDAVAMMPFDHWWPRALPGNVAHFDHAIKTKRMRLFPTWHFVGTTERAFYRTDWENYGSPTSHRDIGESKILGNNDSYNWIKGEAVAAGVSF